MKHSLKRLKKEQWKRITKRDKNKCAVCGKIPNTNEGEYLFVRRMDDRYKARKGSEPDEIMNSLCFDCNEHFHKTGTLADRSDVIALR